jgi:hypothetical protein
MTEWQRRVFDTWRDVLGEECPDLDATFFEAGGNSLLLAEVQSRLEACVGLPLRTLDLINHLTIRSLSQHLEQLSTSRRAE